MPSETRSPDEIERDIKRDREGLDETIEGLQDKISVDAILRQVSDQFRGNGRDIGRSVANSVKENPIALALTGVGLAWMIFGSGSSRATTAPGYAAPPELPGRVSPEWAHDDPEWAHSEHRHLAAHGPSPGHDAAGPGPAASRTQGAADSLKGAAGRAGEAASHGWRSSTEAVGNTARGMGRGVGRTGSRLAHGTETLSDAARARVVRARQRALDAQSSAGRSLGRGQDAARDFYDDQPLVAGALAIAMGAAIGAALHRTRTEDDAVGHYSDSLFDEAERIFQEESEKAMRVGEAAAGEAEAVFDEKKAQLDSNASGDRTASEAAEAEATSAARRVRDAANSEADRQQLGKPKT